MNKFVIFCLGSFVVVSSDFKMTLSIALDFLHSYLSCCYGIKSWEFSLLLHNVQSKSNAKADTTFQVNNYLKSLTKLMINFDRSVKMSIKECIVNLLLNVFAVVYFT